jgi:hypothetical protein
MLTITTDLVIGGGLLASATTMAVRMYWITRPPSVAAASTRTGPRTAGDARVNTPVSLVSTALIEAAGSDTREIARRTGLARDAVAMMLARTELAAHARRRVPRFDMRLD